VLPVAEARELPIDSEAGLGQIACVEHALRLMADASCEPILFSTHPELLYALIERLRASGRRVRPLCGLAWVTTAPALVAVAH